MQEQLQHSSTVGFAMGCDIALNYPLWVAAKRLSVGTTAFPSTLRAVYRGGGALFLSLGPTTIIEDAGNTSSPEPTPRIPPCVTRSCRCTEPTAPNTLRCHRAWQ